MKTYIYIIENKLNGDCYVGKSNDVERRWKKHRSSVKDGNTHLSRAMRRHGIENFEIRVVDEHDDEMYALQTLEPMWIQRLRESGVGLYNMTDGGEGIVGLEFSEEHRRKLSEAAKLRDNSNRGPLSEETKRKIAESNRGRTISEETRAKQSAAAKRRAERIAAIKPQQIQETIPKKRGPKPGTKRSPLSEEHKQKLREANTGKSLSSETRQKISESNRGKPKPDRSIEHCQKLSEVARSRGPMSDEQRAKISESMKKAENIGHRMTEEVRQKIAESLRGQVQSEETRARRAESMRKAWEKRRTNLQDQPS